MTQCLPWPGAGIPAWLIDAFAVVAGASMVLAFAPFELRVFAVLAPAGLFLIWLHSTPRRAFWRGYLFALAEFSCGIYWVYHSIREFGHAPATLAGAITVLFIMVLAVYTALTGGLVNRFMNGPVRYQLAVAYPAMWVLLEWLRSWLFTGFPWLLLGQAQIDTPLAGIVPVFGVLGASGLTALSAGLTAFFLIGKGRARLVALGLLAVIWLSGFGLGRLGWTQPVGEPLRVSLVQGNIPQAMKWRQDQRAAILNRYATLSRAHWDSDIVVWPESAIPDYYRRIKDSFLAPLFKQARAHQTDLLTGLFYYEPSTGATYNSVVALADGERPGFYHKRHLVPFGEYLPLRGLLRYIEPWLSIPMSDLSAGQGRPLLRLRGYPVGVSICYEDAYGNEVIDAMPEARLLVNVSNDAWFGDSLAPPQHLEIARLRALETGRFLLRSTNTGISAVVDPEGRLIARSPQFKTDVLTADVVPRAGSTPYSIWGNRAIVTLLILVLLIMGWMHHARGVPVDTVDG